MRVLKVLVLLLLVFAHFGAASAQTNLKLGYINSQRILEQDSTAQAAVREFEGDLARYQVELQQLEQEGQALMDQYEQQQAMLSEEARAAREEEIRLKQIQYQQRAAELDQQAAARRAELLQPVMEMINTVIQELRTEGGFSMIFDSASQGLVAADPALDLTPAVLTRLQSAARPGASPRR